MTAPTIKDLLKQAEQTEALGIPVDWKTLCYRVLDTSQAHVDAAVGQLSKVQGECQLNADSLAIDDDKFDSIRTICRDAIENRVELRSAITQIESVATVSQAQLDPPVDGGQADDPDAPPGDDGVEHEA